MKALYDVTMDLLTNVRGPREEVWSDAVALDKEAMWNRSEEIDSAEIILITKQTR